MIKAFIVNNGGYMDIITDEEEAKRIDPNYELSDLYTLDMWTANTDIVIDGFILTSDGVVEWYEEINENTEDDDDSDDIGEYRLIYGEQPVRYGSNTYDAKNIYSFEALLINDIISRALDVISLANVLIKTQDDLNEMYELKYSEGGDKGLFFILCEMRRRKIEQNKMTKKQFLQMYVNDPLEALERLFQEQVLKRNLKKVEKVGADVLFDRHSKDPNAVMLNLVK